MKRVFLLAGLCVPMSATLAQVVAPPPARSVPPPIVSTAVQAPARRVLLAWMPGEVRCAGVTVAATPMRRPWTSLYWSAPTGDAPKPVVYLFAIDADGRPLSIKRDQEGYTPFGDDIAPSLAAVRFGAGSARSACSVTYTARRTPLMQAPVEDLISYILNPISGPLPKEGWDRIRTPGSTCSDGPRPQPLTQVFPDFRAIPGTPGVKNWSMIVRDQDAAGKPTHVRVAYSTGNSALNAASLKAMKASRYTGGSRTGCFYPYWRAAEKMPAPPMPEEAAFRPADATCPEGRDWATQPVLRFPDAYRRRSIEGWAIVSYDIAPWGEIGDVKVLAAQPSDDFGRQAMQVLRSAKRAPSGQGATGCIDRVRFVMGPAGGVHTNEVPPPPPF